MQRLFFVIFILFPLFLFSQENQINENGYSIFYHDNGKISSEGILRNGKPDGYWKTYNEAGILVSEGNRKDFELDSLWKFYSDAAQLVMEITYKNDKKNGIRTIFRNDETIEETFENDIKNGPSYFYYPDGNLKKSIPFEDGLENGLAKEFANDKRIITLITYKKGFITNRQRINRFDQQNKKQGKWKYFHKNGIVSLEGSFKHGKKHGYFKTFDKKGNLLEAQKWINGEEIINVAELSKLEIRKEYYPSGQVKTIASFKNDVPEGVRKEFAADGEIERSFILKNGQVIGEGLITEKGEKDGFWKEYFDSGKLKAEGNYKKDIRTGQWKFYHRNKQLEQIGQYDDTGKFIGEWKWYYENGSLLRKEFYRNGLADGLMTEYDPQDNIVAEGDYINGLENGFWSYNYGDIKLEGDYIDGQRNGKWKHYFGDGTLSFEGSFVDDNPNGHHVYYWPNGMVKDDGNYVMGKKNGEWTQYANDGAILLVIQYQQGIEKKYDGIKISSDNK
jgi:uncharacterized protein